MKRYRQILPQPTPVVPTRPLDENERPNLKRKRSQTTKVACNMCRQKKRACDGTRPICGHCKKRGIKCVYVTEDESETPAMALKRENEALKESSKLNGEFLEYLRNAPKEAAWNMVETLRRSKDPESVIRSVTGLPNNLVSAQRTALAVLPPVHSQVELELMVKHPAAYPKFNPPDFNHIATGPLSMASDSSNLFWKSPPQQTVFPESPPLTDDAFEGFRTTTGITHMSIPSTHSYRTFPMTTTATVPIAVPPPKYSDSRLFRLDVTKWTNVPITNHVVADAISIYVDLDSPVLGLFDVDLFIRDLVRGKKKYCSNFLFSSFLSFALQMHSYKNPEALSLSQQLLDEATSLYPEAIRMDSLNTMAALNLLFQSTGCSGQTAKATEYIVESYKMAKRMKLYGVADRIGGQEFASLSPEDQRAISQTTWGCFNGQAMPSLFHVIDAPKYPPIVPTPGSMAAHQFGGYYESNTCLPSTTYMCEISAAFCGFWSITAEIISEYHKTNVRHKVSEEFARSKYLKLLLLADGFHEIKIHGDHNVSHTLAFHIWYHSVILELFRPFIPPKMQYGLVFYSPSVDSPQAIFAASVKQLKQLLLLYQKQQPAALGSILWHVGLMHISNAAIRDTADPNWRFYFEMCIRGYGILSRSFVVAREIIKGLLSLAINEDRITRAEARLLLGQISGCEFWTGPSKSTRGGYVVDLDTAVTDPDAAQVTRLADNFEEITPFDEFTNGVV